jgi:VanZ family protein
MESDRTTGQTSAECSACQVSVKNAWLRWLPVIIWMAVIYRASATPDLRAVPWAQRFHLLPELMGPAMTDLLELILRKACHMAEYALLAGLVRWALAGVRPAWSRARVTGIAFGTAVLYAMSDEWHQTFVPTRTGTPRDVVIDAVGAAMGLLLIGWWLARRQRKAGMGTAGK